MESVVQVIVILLALGAIGVAGYLLGRNHKNPFTVSAVVSDLGLDPAKLEVLKDQLDLCVRSLNHLDSKITTEGTVIRMAVEAAGALAAVASSEAQSTARLAARLAASDSLTARNAVSRARGLAAGVADDLQSSIDRADAVETGNPGEAADAGLRSDPTLRSEHTPDS